MKIVSRTDFAKIDVQLDRNANDVTWFLGQTAGWVHGLGMDVASLKVVKDDLVTVILPSANVDAFVAALNDLADF